MNKIFIGIDFSLTSPAFCIINNDKIKVISLYKVDDIDKQAKNKKYIYLTDCKDVTSYLLEKPKAEGSYEEGERLKLQIYQNFVQRIISALVEEVPQGSDIVIGMEGISFGSSGNTLIDISMSTALLRQELVKTFLPKGDYSKLHIWSPSSIKKYAGRGNFKKFEMYEALLLRPEIQDAEFIKALHRNKPDWITKGGAVTKPVEDLVDAVWIALKAKDLYTK